MVGLARCVAAVLPKMIAKNSGTFVGVSSVAGFRGMPGSSGYGPSKAGQLNFLESIRTDLAGSKVLIQTVSPGFVKTPMTDVNEFKMPFIISAEQAAKTIVKGIEKRKTEIIFPLPMAITMKLARLVPLSIWPKLFKKG
jgi:short-subunit dehydrogenase